MGRKIPGLTVALGCAIAGLLGIASPAVAASSSAPVGEITMVSARFDNQVALSGNALEPQSTGSPVTVRFYVGATFVGQTQTVVCGQAAVIGCWSASPEQIHIPVELGGRAICAYGIDVDGVENGLLGCTLPYPSAQTAWGPIGSLDVAAVAPGLIQLKGWAGDVDGDRTTQLRVYSDGRLVVQRTADQPRADVYRAIHDVGPMTGFNFTLPSRPGPHQICVYAQNTGWSTAGNSTVGCVARTVPGVQPAGAHDPRGALDSVRLSPTSGAGFLQWLARGWAFDPDTSAPTTVLFRT